MIAACRPDHDRHAHWSFGPPKGRIQWTESADCDIRRTVRKEGGKTRAPTWSNDTYHVEHDAEDENQARSVQSIRGTFRPREEAERFHDKSFTIRVSRFGFHDLGIWNISTRVISIRKNEIPSVAAILAPVGDDVAWEPPSIFAGMGDEKAPSTAIDTHDLEFGFHPGSLPEIVAAGIVQAGSRSSRVTVIRVRVVAGTLRGRRISAPEGRQTRPTTDRTREAMFNALVSLGVLDDAVVVDLFAGSGALGIEALSRGAARCTFVEGNAQAVAVIRDNVRTLGLEDRSEIIGGRVETALRTLGAANVIVVDPPYGYDRWPELLTSLEGALAADGVVVVESGADIEPIAAASGRWDVVRSKKYGRTWVSFLQRI